MTKLKCKVWENGSMLFEDDSTALFLNPQQIKYCVNWLNLHNNEIRNEECVTTTHNEPIGITLNSVNGITMIHTERDFALYNSGQLSQFKEHINANRKLIGCQEVIE